MKKENLIVTFSGGETSGYMCYLLKEHLSHLYNFLFIYANTGLEHEKTLEFVDKCDKYFNLNLVWVEAVVYPNERKASSHKVVNFKTASRNGEPFKEVIKKYGLPNKHFFHCTRELKNNPITSYCNSICIDDLYMTNEEAMLNGGISFENPNSKFMFPFYKARRVLGIRADEQKRIKVRVDAWYPLNSVFVITKEDVKDFWKNQPFQLDLPEHLGNCRACYKKSEKKLQKVAEEEPDAFDFFIEMENKYSHLKSKDENTPRKIYRFERTAFEVKNNLNLPKHLQEEDECAEECGSVLSDYESVELVDIELNLFDFTQNDK